MNTSYEENLICLFKKKFKFINIFHITYILDVTYLNNNQLKILKLVNVAKYLRKNVLVGVGGLIYLS